MDLVVKEQDSGLTQQLTQHLEGQQAGASPRGAPMTDDTAANTTYLVLLYMALRRHEEAAEVAVGLARRAQEAGNYKACTASAPPTTCHSPYVHLFVVSLQCASWDMQLGQAIGDMQLQLLSHQPARHSDVDPAMACPSYAIAVHLCYCPSSLLCLVVSGVHKAPKHFFKGQIYIEP